VDPSAVPGPVPRPLRGSSTDPADDVLAGYRAPSGRVLDKVIHHLDEHCTAFIRLSPFATLATASPDGWPEVSPRGGEPGFVRVLDSSHLALPDRQGNNRIDSLRNVAENPRAALMFFVPGIDETLRVYGTTSLVPTGALGIDVTEFGRQPLSVLVLGGAGLLPVLQGGHALRSVGSRAPGGAVGLPALLRDPAGPLPGRHHPRRGDAARRPGAGALRLSTPGSSVA
jgi:predicted pyridoxine 5'-phosphate oxidase superfamily flavin-nucleotide-binding protein